MESEHKYGRILKISLTTPLKMLFPVVLLLKFPVTLSFTSTNPEAGVQVYVLAVDIVFRWIGIILQSNAFVEPVPSSTGKKSKKKSKLQIAKDTAQQGQKDLSGGDSGMVDIWDDKGELVIKTKKKPKTSVIPAVEVEPPGCSFNPPSESHQDALACAVADEMQKIYRNELGPEPIPLVVPGEAVNEEDMYFLEADSGSDTENENLVEDGKTDLDKRSQKPKMLTQVEKNRRARRKEQLKAEAEATKAAQLSKEIDSLPDIIQEIEREEGEKQKRHLRRVTAIKEKLKSCPPRLGKRKTSDFKGILMVVTLKNVSTGSLGFDVDKKITDLCHFRFVPAPAQVLLSEEITGSLRKLKGCCTLARDRFKSLEKRGLVVPSKKSSSNFDSELHVPDSGVGNKVHQRELQSNTDKTFSSPPYETIIPSTWMRDTLDKQGVGLCLQIWSGKAGCSYC
ncbi:hypothetical protein H5410_007044 [Solanum commersonii]|uniref:Ribosome biogenesis protein NOP53 n=1 Tax=Solanum commersonii TaxID=4109 RepID=A0A9J6ACC4_SOLCO|nr:hypothetical protein H5410_007044 [Solanum commersonii]